MKRPWLANINYDELDTSVATRIKELEKLRDEELASVEDVEIRVTTHKNGRITRVTTHSKIRTKYNTKIGTLLKHNVECNWQNEEARKKEVLTKRAIYGSAFVGDREKAAQTKAERYGSPTYNNAAKAEQTKQLRYGRHGVVNIEASNESKQRRVEAGDNFYLKGVKRRKQLYGEHFELIVDKMQNTNSERYGVPFYCMTDDCQQKLRANISKLNKTWQQKIFDAIGVECQFEVKPKDSNGDVKFSYDLGYNNILIDINPWWSHNLTYAYQYIMKMSTTNNVKIAYDYHRQRQIYAQSCGYRLIQVWPWDDEDKVLQLICNTLKQSQQVIYARKCRIAAIDQKTAKQFQSTYHLQGSVWSQQWCYGLYHNDSLVQVMTFGMSRFLKKSNTVELLRLCSSNCIVVGGASKLFKHFVDNILQQGQQIISYCDLSKFEGNVYEQLGFKLADVSIGEHYYNTKNGQHHLATTLRQLGADRLIGTNLGKGTDNHQIMIDNDFVFMTDAGQQKWLYQKC